MLLLAYRSTYNCVILIYLGTNNETSLIQWRVTVSSLSPVLVNLIFIVHFLMSIMHNACCSQAQGRGELKEGKRMKGGGGEGGR